LSADNQIFCLKFLFCYQIRFPFDSAGQGCSTTPPSSYDPGPLYVGFVVREVVLPQVYLRVLRFSFVYFANARILAIDIIVK